MGSWLSGWLHEQQRNKPTTGIQAIQEVESQLKSQPKSPLEPEPEPVRYLRSYSRYMSPRVGLLSADTWTLVAIFLRNLFLNWLVLLPLMAAVLMIPRMSVVLVRLGTRKWFQDQEGWVLPLVFGAAVILGSVAIAYIIINRSGIEERRPIPARLRGQKWFLTLGLLPLYLMSILIALDWAWIRSSGAPLSGLRFAIQGWEIHPVVFFVLFGVLLHVGGFLLSRIWVRKSSLWEILVILSTGALGGISAWGAASLWFPTVHTVLLSEAYVCFAAPLLLFLFLLAATLFVGLSSYYTNDSDREWLARAGAWVLIAIVFRSAFSCIVIFGPDALLDSMALISSLGGISGMVTLFLGRSPKTSATKNSSQQAEGKRIPSILDLALTLAAPIFTVFILIVLSLATTLLIAGVTRMVDPGHLWPTQQGFVDKPAWLIDIVYNSPWWAIIGVFAGLVLIGGFMGGFVDINRFSLHAAYRDRLIRAYMGASRGGERNPHPFTGFDEGDNFQMRDLRGNRPFHVVNMALNLVRGKDLAWQDRKAETFTVSPLHAGNYCLGYRDVAEYGLHRNGKNALSLGTAMAISGAAASPNMGYHSSPIVTFLLALFNVRLGWWLGNPGDAGNKSYKTPGPRFAPLSLFEEALGLTDDQHPYVYLSDGGHFENLGLYEMILRRCHFIVVSDGGADPDFTFEDLGNAVSKIRVDLGVPIDFDQIMIRPHPKHPDVYDAKAKKAVRQSYCALARIRYSCVDSVANGKVEDGLLLYIKPSLNGTEPADVFHYSRLHPSFPHESTANQLYTESQFESYRELGSHAMECVLGKLPAEASIADLFAQIEKDLA